MTIADALTFAQTQLSRFEQPQYEARELVGSLLGLTASDLMVKEGILLTPQQDRELKEWLNQRANGVPLAYLSGVKGFYKHEFIVERGVLVPRPETELVVETALARSREKRLRKIADLGCGTGCIGLSILSEVPEADLWCLDISIQACGVAAKNATKLNLDEHVFVLNVAVERWKPKHALDLIVANPPYIPLGDTRVQKSVHLYEPHEALYSGADGLDALRVWTQKSAEWLTKGGLFVCEIGAGQSLQVGAIMAEAGFTKIETARDLAGIERVLSGVMTHG